MPAFSGWLDILFVCVLLVLETKFLSTSSCSWPSVDVAAISGASFYNRAEKTHALLGIPPPVSGRFRGFENG